MKPASASLNAHLASGATTLCRCWRLTRRDGTVFGFTDHDQPLAFDGTLFDPESGFAASDLQTSLGLAVDTMEVDGALSSERIRPDDIALGLWDAAEVEIFLVNWKAPSDRLVLRRGILGEVARGDLAYRAEIRSLAHALNQDQGRSYQRICDTRLGSPRCTVNLDDVRFRGEGQVLSASDDRILTVAGLSPFADGWFSFGTLTWATGLNVSALVEVKSHGRSGVDGSTWLTLFQRAARSVAVGDRFVVAAGCDRSFAMCSARFGNSLNFQGFPHIPGNDFSLSYARRDKVNDGGSLFHG